MTDWGAHHLDIGQWGLGLDRSGPVRVEAKPMVEMISGGFTAFSEYEVKYGYANGVTLTCRSTTANAWNGSVLDPNGQQHGVRFTGKDGWIFVTRGKIAASDPDLLSTPLPSTAERLPVSDNHMRNFFDCVRSRERPICDVEVGHRSASVCHLGVIALRLGRKLEWNPGKEEFVGDPEANQWVCARCDRPGITSAFEDFSFPGSSRAVRNWRMVRPPVIQDLFRDSFLVPSPRYSGERARGARERGSVTQDSPPHPDPSLCTTSFLFSFGQTISKDHGFQFHPAAPQRNPTRKAIALCDSDDRRVVPRACRIALQTVHSQVAGRSVDVRLERKSRRRHRVAERMSASGWRAASRSFMSVVARIEMMPMAGSSRWTLSNCMVSMPQPVFIPL